jgi:hypothetical protein
MSERLQMPPLSGAAEWINSEPLSPEQLRGQVVLVDFWTLTCINWLRTQPYVRAWWQSYRDDGLIVIGVHTPEFSFEHDADLVREAVRERGIDYPVAIDNHYRLWTAFDNHYWPAQYVLDRQGMLRDFHFGEGRYEGSEHSLQKLLGVGRELVTPRVEGKGVEAAADWDSLRSPETYLGYTRASGFASPGRAVPDTRGSYEFPTWLPLNHWALDGQWTSRTECVVLDEAGGGIAFKYLSRDVHLVASPGARQPIAFHVFIDGEPPGSSHGVDVDEDGNGLLREGRMYQLVREYDRVRERTLEVTFLEPGAEAYVFTFG